MADGKRFFQTTAIDYPNSRPHIGTAFEKIGADVQARYRRKDRYEGWYCNGCEAFKTERELVDGKCPLHPNTSPVRRSEDCYYFEQSKFRDRLLRLYEERPEFIQPESRRNEIVALVKEGLQ